MQLLTVLYRKNGFDQLHGVVQEIIYFMVLRLLAVAENTYLFS